MLNPLGLSVPICEPVIVLALLSGWGRVGRSAEREDVCSLMRSTCTEAAPMCHLNGGYSLSAGAPTPDSSCSHPEEGSVLSQRLSRERPGVGSVTQRLPR